MAQVTSVSELADVQPSDWSYDALRLLVEQYDVIEGYPDGRFRGNQPMTRYEFAAALARALDRIQERAQAGDRPSATTLETLERLQDEFASELATVRDRVDQLEPRVAALQANTFSTTVQLNGEVILGLSTADGGNPPGSGEASTVFTATTNLQLGGSFTGRDAFRVGLSAGTFGNRGFASPTVLNTNMALLSFQSETDGNLELSSLEYRFAIGDRLVITLKPVGFSLISVLSPNSIYSSAGDGAISRFASFNPVFRIGGLDSGVGADFLLTDRARLQVAYGARNASDSDQGLFASDQRALGVQLYTRPFDDVTLGLAYINAFSEDGALYTFTGSNNADISGGFGEPAAIHAISGTMQWRMTPGLVLGAWGGVIGTDSLPTDAAALSTTYLFSLGFPDIFGREGDLFAVMLGQPPRLRIGTLIEREDDGSGLHYEVFYRWRVNDHIAITPGFFIVTQPGHIEDNNTIFVGTLRTTLRF